MPFHSHKLPNGLQIIGESSPSARSAAVGFFGDAQKFPAIVLAELDVEVLALDLQFSRLDDVVHSLQAAESNAVDRRNGRRFLPSEWPQTASSERFLLRFALKASCACRDS